MVQVNIREAKTQLSRLLKLVEAGEEVVIARNGVPVARLVAVPKKRKPQPGQWKGSSSSTTASLTRYLRNSWPTLSHNRYAQLRKPRST